MRRLAASTIALASVLITGCQDQPTAPRVAPGQVGLERQASREKIPGQYIVTLRKGIPQLDLVVQQLAATHNARVMHVYRHALQGFSASLSESAAAALARNPNVVRVEPDRMGSIVGSQSNPPNWGIDRVDQRNLPLNNSYTWGYSGLGVRIYILDTGIRLTHNDFGGRAFTGTDIISPGGNADDCFGHGTHVAGIAGSSTYGLAKTATLYAVRIVDCNGFGSASQAIAGVDWVTGQKNANPSWVMVANMSVHYGLVQSLNDAVENSIASGVTYAIAAANDSADACNDSPGSSPSAITVAASASNDAFAWFSNWGSCVDVIAPGVDILSTYNSSNWATATMSGTSMAAPHVAGTAALYLDYNPALSPSAVAAAISSDATADVISGVPGGTPNRLLYTNAPTPPPSPTVSIGGSNPVRPGATCVYWGNPSSGTPPYTYRWTVNGVPIGDTSSEVLYTNSGSNFTVGVTVFDARLNTGTSQRTITVSSSAKVCFI